MIKENPLYSEKGITLVELVVAMGILSILIVVLSSMFINSNKLFYEGEEKSFNQTHMRNAVDEITKDLRYAKNLTMLEDNNIPLDNLDNSKLDGEEEYKFVYFNKEDESISLLEHTGSVWIEKKYLEERINIEDSYFLLNSEDDTIKFEVVDKSEKHEKSKRFSLTTTINLLNAGNSKPFDPEEIDPPNKYRGVKYKAENI